jgi:hypothetical protein
LPHPFPKLVSAHVGETAERGQPFVTVLPNPLRESAAQDAADVTGLIRRAEFPKTRDDVAQDRGLVPPTNHFIGL